MPTAPTGDRLLRGAPGKSMEQPERQPREAGEARHPPVPEPGLSHPVFQAINHRRRPNSWHRIPRKQHGPNRLPRPTRKAPGRHLPEPAARQHGPARDRKPSHHSHPCHLSHPNLHWTTRDGARRRHRQAEPAGAEAIPLNQRLPVGRTGASPNKAGALRQPAPPGQAGERVRRPKAKEMAGTIRHRLNRMQPGKRLRLRQPHRHPSLPRPPTRLPDGLLRTRAHPAGAHQPARRTIAAGASRPPIQGPPRLPRLPDGPQAEAAPGKEPVNQQHRQTAEPPGAVRPQPTWQVRVQVHGRRSRRQGNRPRQRRKPRPRKTQAAGPRPPLQPPAGEPQALNQAPAGLRVREPRQEAALVRPDGAQVPLAAAPAGETAPRRHRQHPRLRKSPVDGACRRRQRANLKRQDGVRRHRLNKPPDGRLPLRRHPQHPQHRQQAAGEALKQLRRRQQPMGSAGVRKKIQIPGEAVLRASKVARTGRSRPSRWKPALSKRSRRPV